MATKTYKPLTATKWANLPTVVRYFHPWERASKPLTIDLDTRQAIEPQPARKPAKRTRSKSGKR